MIGVRLDLKRCTDMGMTTRKMMSPQPQTEADSLEMTNTVQMIKICHSAIDAHHIGLKSRKLTLHSWQGF